MNWVWLKALMKALILPPTGLLLVVLAGLALAARRPRFGRAIAAGAVVLLLVVSMPVTADFLTRFVDTAPALDLARARQAQAVVILGGGIRRAAPEYDGDTIGTLTLERVRYGARVARLTGLPVLVTGGVVLAGTPEAHLMRVALEQEFGVPVRWVENRSRTTRENAERSAAMLRRDGVDRIVLVAHDVDMRRALAEFSAQGLDVIGAPTGKRGDLPYVALDFVPGMRGLLESYYATYEIVGNIFYALSRR